MRDIRRSELGKEDVLAALNELSIDHHRAADARLPERQIEYVMQSERDERTLDDTENQRADVARTRDEAAECENAILRNRLDEVKRNADKEVDDRRDDGDEARTAEERKCIGQYDLMELIVEVRNTDTDDDAAKHAHLI